MSPEEKTRISVDIYGMQYTIAGHSSSMQMRRVAEHVDEQMNRIGKVFPKLDIPRVAVLAAVNIADGFLRQRDEMESKREGIQNVMVEEHQALQQEYKKMDAKLAEVEAREQSYKQQLDKLQEEYAKLQNEYNEWIQLASLDQPES